MRNTPLLGSALLLSAALLSLRPAVAATVTWDTSPAAGFQSGNGTWGTDNFWSANGTILSPWVSGDAAVFLGGATAVTDTINLSSAQTISGLTFGSANSFGSWNLAGSGLSLGSNSSFSVNAGSTAAITSVLSGAFNITKSGTGVLELSGANTYSGQTFVNAGTLIISSGSALGVAGFNFQTMTFVRSDATLALRGGITFAEHMQVLGTGVDGLGAIRSLSGNNQLTERLALVGAATIGVDAGILTLTNQIYDDPSAFVLTKVGTGELVLNGVNTYRGGTTISAGTITLGNGAALGTGVLTLTAGTLNLNNQTIGNAISLGAGEIVGTGTISGIISGASSFIKSGAGTLTFSGNNTYSGGTTIQAGIMVLGSGSALGAGAVSLTGGTLNLNGQKVNNAITLGGGAIAGSGEIAGVISGTSLFTNAGGTVTLSGSNTYSGGTSITSGTLILGSGTALGTGGVALTGGTLNLNGQTVNNAVTLGGGVINGSGVLAGVVAGAASFSKSGAGTVELSGANTYSGQTFVNAGTLIISSGSALGVAGFNFQTMTFVRSDATLALRGGITFAEHMQVLGTGVDGLGAIRSLSGNNQLTERLALVGAATIGVDAGILTLTNQIYDDPSAFVLTKVGTGELVLNGGNTYRGGTTISAGSLSVGRATALGTGNVTISGGTLNLGAFSLANMITLSAGTLTGSQLNGDKLVLQGGEVSGIVVTGTLTKTGNGTVTLSGANTYAGGTTVSAGTLVVNNANALGSGAVTIAGGTLDLAALTFANTITLTSGFLSGSQLNGAKLVLEGGEVIGNVVSGTLSKTGSGTVTLSGANSYAGGTTVSAGTLVLNNVNALGTGSVALSGASLDVKGNTFATDITLTGSSGVLGANGTLSGLISGSGSLTKSGEGLLTISGNNTYAGGTTVSSGSLTVGSGTALGTGDVALSGGTLNLNAQTINNNFTVGGGTLVVNNADALGAGSVTLSGGSLDVKANTVAKDITLTSDSTVAGANGTISGVISGSGLLTKVGSGSLTLSGNNTFAGGALVNAGTLQVNGEVLGNLVVSSGAKLAGSGIVHDVTVVAGGSINAGGVDAVGTLRADSLSLQGGAKVELNFSDASLGGGAGFDRFLLSGQLDLSAVSVGNKLTLLLLGLPTTFDPAGAYSFGFITYGSLNLGANGNISDLFTIDASGLKDQFGASLDISKFSLVDDAANNQVRLNYLSEIPEPSTYGLSLGCLGLAVAAVRRRRRLASA